MAMTRPAPPRQAGRASRTAQTRQGGAAARAARSSALEPTPENYERAVSGHGSRRARRAIADATAGVATLIERIVRGIERGGRHWTPARKKESLQRVLGGSRGDAKRLQQRLCAARRQLGERHAATPSRRARRRRRRPGRRRSTPPARAAADARAGRAAPRAADAPRRRSPGSASRARSATRCSRRCRPHDGAQPRARAASWPQLLDAHRTARARRRALADELEALCAARRSRVLQHRHHLVDQLGELCHELTASLTDLAEDDSWAKGQCEAMQAQARRRPDRARRARRQRHCCATRASARASCAASASGRATRSRR